MGDQRAEHTQFFKCPWVRRILLKSNSIGKQRERFDPYKRRAQGASKYGIDMHKLLRFLKVNSIEYGLLAAGIAVAIIAAVNATRTPV